MGLTDSAYDSGFYTLKTKKTGKCLVNPSANEVSVADCKRGDPKSAWFYDKKYKTVCNKSQKNYCLQNLKSDDHKVTVTPTVFSSAIPTTKQWVFNAKNAVEARAVGGSLCNVATGQCIENGAPSSLALSVAAYNDDKADNKKWILGDAECLDSVTIDAKAALLSKSLGESVCKQRCGEVNGTYASYYGSLLKSTCTCSKYDTCTA